MQSKFFKIILAIVVVALVGYVGLDFFLGSIVKGGVNRFGPSITQTRVELAGAQISPVSGSGTLTGLFVGNPAGWNSDKAFYFAKIQLAVDPSSILGDHVVVKEISIDGPEFVYETKVVSSNIGDLLKNIDGGSSNSSSKQATASNGKPMKFEVKHFVVQNGRVTVGVGAKAVTLPMPRIELTDLGTKEGGITSDQLALAIMRNLSASVVSATTGAAAQIGSTMGAAASSAVKGWH